MMEKNPSDLTVDQDAHLDDIRLSVRAICAGFGEDYWRDLDAQNGYPTAFVEELTKLGFLGALIPTEYGDARSGLFPTANNGGPYERGILIVQYAS